MSNRWPGKTVIGVTGNIATGKSVVRRMLEHVGAFGIDADGLAHRAMSPNAPAYQPVIDTFGKWILDANGRIDREKLAKVVLNDPEALAQLEALTHPLVIQVIDLLVKRASQKVVVIEAIKLFETGLAEQCDTVWVVDAPENIQIKRLMEQRKLSEQDARMRVNAQPPQSEKKSRAVVVVDNSGGYESTFDQIQAALDKLIGKAEAAPEPVKEVVSATPPGEVEIAIQRGGPKLAEDIAKFINQNEGLSLSRTDILVRFGQKAYMLAYAGEQIVGLAGWQVENLIARTDEFLIGAGAPVENTVKSLLKSIEKASNELQAEVSLMFLKNDTSDEIRKAVLTSGYEKHAAADLNVPDWREAAEESHPPETYLVVKRLRADRVLKPV
ncbi:MAG: dephospho-CoA kinase [Anaerolineae bacterium]|nr:dephospho-CoA kinase [Anaerolineae bacterium]